MLRTLPRPVVVDGICQPPSGCQPTASPGSSARGRVATGDRLDAIRLSSPYCSLLQIMKRLLFRVVRSGEVATCYAVSVAGVSAMRICANCRCSGPVSPRPRALTMNRSRTALHRLRQGLAGEASDHLAGIRSKC